MNNKFCSRCKRTKDITEFQRKQGKTWKMCNECNRKAQLRNRTAIELPKLEDHIKYLQQIIRLNNLQVPEM